MDFTSSENMAIKRALLDAIQSYEKDLVIFNGTPLADLSRMYLVDAKSALKKMKGE